MAAADTPQLLMNAPLVASRLGYPDLSGLDLLELFAFVHPATFCVPTPKGLAHALGLDEPADDAGVPLEISPLMIRMMTDGQARYGTRAQSDRMIERLEEATGLSILADGFPQELVDDEPEDRGYEVLRRH